MNLQKKISKGIIELILNGAIISELVVYVTPKDLKKMIPKGYESITIRDVPVLSRLDIPENCCYIVPV